MLRLRYFGIVENGILGQVPVMNALDPNAGWQVGITALASRLGFMKEVVRSVSAAVIDNAWIIVSTTGNETGVHRTS